MLTLKVRDELADRVCHADGEDDGFQAVDCVDLQVNLLSLHLLLEESESVYVFDHVRFGWVKCSRISSSRKLGAF